MRVLILEEEIRVDLDDRLQGVWFRAIGVLVGPRQAMFCV